ncbi:YaiO family outer membrane beta-barrel protein [Mucilaginibacter sp. UYCu711]|uniref:YaiO family outer membrane beta-barrel protein n=1 Tax=Mucilaginibacter sp. UYCu711 TaxID=3156339 RepID=UPI003D2228E9
MKYILTAFCIMFIIHSFGQSIFSSDELFQAARKSVFDRKDYPKAKDYLYHALQKSPDYSDIRIFLGRIYTWTDNPDSARICFNRVIETDPGYEDCYIAYTDLEYWNNRIEHALIICESGLKFHPQSQELLLRKSKILNAMKRYKDAELTVQQLLIINKNNPAARSLADRIKELSSKNKLNLSYEYVNFDKQFSDPWHYAMVDYGRNTRIGTITGRLNYANRFRDNGYQFELESYPHLSDIFYSYVNVGYSDKVGVFPNWRGGFSLYANLPKSFEAGAGVRYLKFSGDPTWIYTAYLGKYYKSWLFSGSTYVTPSTYTSTLSASYSISAKYYYGSADDVLGVTAGYGISPDDRLNSIQLDNKIRLTSYKAGFSFKKKISRTNVLSFDADWYNQDYRPQTRGNQYQISLGWLLRF